jgi:hypothetical protein
MESYEAANESTCPNIVKANVNVFADTGLMALLCCCDQPIYYTNINPPGEQQKYPLALLVLQCESLFAAFMLIILLFLELVLNSFTSCSKKGISKQVIEMAIALSAGTLSFEYYLS